MDDLISRQAAIDALEKIFPVDQLKNEYTQGITVGAALATEYIKQLPSAQPKQRWIPCSERLPEKEVVYIITVHYDDRNFITFDNFCSYKHGWKEWSNQEVLAWMPLPEPYREEK